MARKNRPSVLSQVEQHARLTAADFSRINADYVPTSFAAIDLTARIERAGEKNQGAGRPQRSEDAPRRDAPPPTNRGGKSDNGPASVRLVLEDGVIKEVTRRSGYAGDAAFVDWVNFTCHEQTFETKDSFLTPDEVIREASFQMELIFGFGITAEREKGANFYHRSFTLGDGWGMVCHGGQRDTVLVMLSGEGCAAASDGWEKRLQDWLERKAKAPRITRLDLAHDDIIGSTYSVDRADKDHTDGLFNCGGRNPDCEHRGNWKNPNGKGRTLNVGSRSNGKFCRVYEKGRQLGDKKSEWVRIEVEFKSVDRVIPFDALTRPGEYLSASFPAFEWINERQERILTTQRVVQAKVDKAVEWIRHQCGASLKIMRELFGSENLLDMVSRDGNPAWSKVPHFSLAPACIHTLSASKPEGFIDASVGAW